MNKLFGMTQDGRIWRDIVERVLQYDVTVLGTACDVTAVGKESP